MAESAPTVARDDENHRYVIEVDGGLAGYTLIRSDAEGRLVMPHTVIIPSFRGRGLAGTLVSSALADIASRGETVVPECQVVAKYLRENEVPGLDVQWPRSE
jgi:predicted GNAT family acetyltransferase